MSETFDIPDVDKSKPIMYHIFNSVINDAFGGMNPVTDKALYDDIIQFMTVMKEINLIKLCIKRALSHHNIIEEYEKALDPSPPYDHTTHIKPIVKAIADMPLLKENNIKLDCVMNYLNLNKNLYPENIIQECYAEVVTGNFSTDDTDDTIALYEYCSLTQDFINQNFEKYMSWFIISMVGDGKISRIAMAVGDFDDLLNYLSYTCFNCCSFKPSKTTHYFKIILQRLRIIQSIEKSPPIAKTRINTTHADEITEEEIDLL